MTNGQDHRSHRCIVASLLFWMTASLILSGVAVAQNLPSGGASAGRQAGLNAANESGNAGLYDDVQDGSVTITITDIPRPGASRNDGQGNGEILVDVGLSPEDTTAVILHEYAHICGGHDGGESFQEIMCDEAEAAQACADGLIDCTSNPDDDFMISCATKATIIDQFTNGSWGCTGFVGPPPAA